MSTMSPLAISGAGQGRIGERYILGGQDVASREMLADIAGAGGPQRADLRPAARAAVSAGLRRRGGGRLTGKEPFVTADALKMAKYRMYFSSAKAERELGYTARPYRRGAVRRARLVPRGGHVK